jgi:predicted ABC-type ATPase
MARRPIIQVLAGVNGAGKSSIGGAQFRKAGVDWFNPDAAAKSAMAELGLNQEEANGWAWTKGFDLLRRAIATKQNFAFETTLGGNSIAAALNEAAASHDIRIWFCGLASPELHIARVKLRVVAGGHDIPEAKIRERWIGSRMNLIQLLPHLAALKVYDNSQSVPGWRENPYADALARIRQGRDRDAGPKRYAGFERHSDLGQADRASGL